MKRDGIRCRSSVRGVLIETLTDRGLIAVIKDSSRMVMAVHGVRYAGRKRGRASAETGKTDGSATGRVRSVVRYSTQILADEAIIGVGAVQGADMVLLRRNGFVEWRTHRLHYQVEHVFVAAAAVQAKRVPTAFAPLSVSNGVLLAIGDSAGQVHFYDSRRALLLESVWVTRGTPVACLAFGPRMSEQDGSVTIACGSADGKLRLFRGPAAVGEAFNASRDITQTAWYLERVIQVSPGVPVQVIDWHPNGVVIAVGTKHGQIRSISTKSGTSETIAVLKRGGEALAVESLACYVDQEDSFLATGDASGRLLLWSLDQRTRGEAIAVFESPDNCHGAITHLRILSSNLILFGSADGSVGFLQRPRTKEQWLIRSRPQRLHRRAVRASGAFYSHKRRGFGLFTGAEDALLCVITDVTQHLQVPGKVQRIGALRTPAMAPVVCWPDHFGTCLLTQKPARSVALQRTNAQAPGLVIDAVTFPANETAPRIGSAAAGTLLGHPKRTFWLELEADTVALYYRRGESAKQIPLSSRQIDALRGATRGIAVLFNVFVVLARDSSCIQVLSVHQSSPESQARVRLRSVTMSSTDVVCLTSDHQGGVGIGFANGTIQRFVVEPGERKPPQLKLLWTSQVQAAPCAMYLDSSTKTIWTIDAAHWLSENGEPRMLLPTPAEECYSLLRPGPNHSLLVADRGRVLQLWLEPHLRYERLFTCTDRIWALNYASDAESVLLIHGADSYAADEQCEEAIGRKRFGT